MIRLTVEGDIIGWVILLTVLQWSLIQRRLGLAMPAPSPFWGRSQDHEWPVLGSRSGRI